jgi:hypothetical protein
MYQERSIPRTNRYNNDLYPDDEDTGYVYFQNHHQEMKIDRTDRKYPFKAALSSQEARSTIYVPSQPTPRPFTRSDQYGLPSPKVEMEKVTPGTRVRQVIPAMTHAALRKLQEKELGIDDQDEDYEYAHVYVNHKFDRVGMNPTLRSSNSEIERIPRPNTRQEMEQKPWRYVNTLECPAGPRWSRDVTPNTSWEIQHSIDESNMEQMNENPFSLPVPAFTTSTSLWQSRNWNPSSGDGR